MKTTETSGKTITTAPTMPGHKPDVQRPQLPPLEEQQQAASRGHRLESLPLGAAGDQYEQEADQAAEQVVQRLESGTGQTGAIQATPTPGPAVQAKGEGTGSGASAAALTQLPLAPGNGRALEPAVRAPMERAFGADLSDVRLHTGRPAQQLNQSLDARATTVGRDIHFAKGEFEPHSAAGRELLAHELTHVLQQQRGGHRLQRARKDSKGKKKAPSATDPQRPTRPAPELVEGPDGPRLVSPGRNQKAPSGTYGHVPSFDNPPAAYGETSLAAGLDNEKAAPNGPYGHVPSFDNPPAAYGETSLAAGLDNEEAAPNGPYGHVPSFDNPPAAYGETSLAAGLDNEETAPNGPYGHVSNAAPQNEYESTDAPLGDGQSDTASEEESSDAPSNGGAVPASHPPLRRTKRKGNLFE
ncbi:MAG: DUF4157 domain-containing protein [Chloroflexota bacterium]|jgi:hypothetical protein